MGAADALAKKYMQDSGRFADAFNFYMYDGRKVIKPEQLREIDTASIILPYGEDAKSVKIQRFRDVMKSVVAMRDEQTAYLLLGLEAQMNIHRAMVIRSMLYDAIQYAVQVEETVKSHRSGRIKPGSSDEFLSGFYRSDKLIPVITLTMYFGADKWDAPTSLHEMFSVSDPGILKYVPDYKLNLIAPYSISDEDFSKFETELSIALKYMKYSKNKEMTSVLLHDENFMERMSRQTAELIGMDMSRFRGKENGGMYNEALESIFDDYRKEGEAKGRAEGRAEGKAEGRAEGRAEGKAEGFIQAMTGLVKDGIISLSDAASRAGMTVREFEERSGLKA